MNVRSGSSTSNPSLYMTGSASNYAVLVQDPAAENSFYRIQSDAVLNADRGSVNKETGKYDYDNMYAYISSNFVTLVNQGGTVNPPAPKVLESISISQPPTRTEYTAGETFDASGMVVMAKWNDGTESDVTAEVTYSTDALLEGTGSITVSYTNEGVTMTAEQAVKVNASVPADNNTPTEGTPAPEQQPTVSTPAPTPEQQPIVSMPALTPTPEQQPADNAPAATQPAEGTPKQEQQPEESQQPTDTTPGTDPKQPGETSSEPVFQPAAGAGRTADQNSAVQAANGAGNTNTSSASANAGQNASDGDGKERRAPRTGDESSLMLWSVLFVMSASGIVSMLQRKRNYVNVR